MSILNWKNKVLGYTPQGGGGKGGGGGGTPNITTQANQYQNISPWASPYISAILGAAQQQVFQTKQNPGTQGYYVDQSGAKVSNDVAAGWQPTTDAEGNQSTNPFTYVPGQAASTEITGINPYTAFGIGGAGMSPEQMAAAQASVAGFTPLQQQAFQGAANLQVPGQYDTATNYASTAAGGALGTTNQAGAYGAQGYQAGRQAAGLSNMYGGQGAQFGQQAGQQAGNLGLEGAAIGRSLGQMSTDPNAVQAYMNPYVQASLQPQLNLLAQQTGIQGAAQQGAATSAGAFGGSRSALQNALVQQAGNLAQQQAIGQGYNTAFQQAQAQMNAANQAALAGQQQALSGAQMRGQLGLAGTAQGLQGAQQAGQLGIQGAQAGLQGVGAQQAGYGLAGQQAANLANIGGQQLAARQGILGLQNQFGTQQQQQQQNVINQAMQNYATAQQYPMTQLGQLRALASGLPMTDTTATQQQQVASPLSQLAGLGTAGIAGLGLYNAMNKK